MAKKERPTIGFLMNQFENTYNSILWKNVVEVSKEKNINIIFFLGKNLLSPYDYEAQYNVIYSLINKKNIDGIIAGEFLKTFITKEELEEFFKKRFSNIPLITLGCKLNNIPAVLLDQKNGVIEAIEHLLKVHNIKKIAFIKGPEDTQDAQERFLAYMEGLKKNYIPFEPNLVVQGNFNRDRGYFAAKELIEKRKIFPEAIIGANDETVLGIMDFLKEKKIKVPKEIKLIGFDDVLESRISIPSITTVRQSLKRQIEVAFELITKIINNEDIPYESKVPCEFIVRESCGCHENHSHLKKEIQKPFPFPEEHSLIFEKAKYKAFEELKDLFSNKDELSNILDELFLNLKKDIEKYENNFIDHLRDLIVEKKLIPSLCREAISKMKSSLLSLIDEREITNILHEIFFNILLSFDKLNERVHLQHTLNVLLEKLKLEYISQYLTTTFNLKNIVNTLKTFLKELNITHFLFCIYKGSVKWDKKFKWNVPKSCKVLLDYRNEISYERENYILNTEDLIPEGFFEKTTNLLAVILPLFFEEEHFGYILINPLPEDDILCESIRREISTSIKGTFLIEREKITARRLVKTLKALKESYNKLEQLSVLDELTGLYNRRGFTTLANQHLELAKRRHRDFLLFFIDLDGLKTINDNFGHKEGDNALIMASKILTKTFRRTDIIARFGGDEFAVLAVDCTINELERIEKRIKHNLGELNKSLNKPYNISLSYGVAPCQSNKLYTFEELMEEADQKLYKEKKKKKEKN